MIFANGSMICSGARSEIESERAARKIAHIIKKLDYPVRFHGFKVNNVVASCNVGFPIKLESFYKAHHNECSVSRQTLTLFIVAHTDSVRSGKPALRAVRDEGSQGDSHGVR
jgi:hypothetical protein